MGVLALSDRLQPDRREAPREEVYHRTRGILDGGGMVALQIVNISATGFMARTETELAPGAALTVRLPVTGERKAEVRWALAGRIGCQFARSIDLADYLQLLGTLAKDTR